MHSRCERSKRRLLTHMQGHKRSLRQAPSEVQQVPWVEQLQLWQRANLRQSGDWLGHFEPMQLGCPLFGRKVARQTVSEFAAVAWQCDGLGFACECLL